MKKIIFPAYILLMLLILFSCKKDFTNQSEQLSTQSVDNYSPTTKGQKFGVLVNASHRYDTSTYLSALYSLADSSKINLSKQYGVKYARLAVTHDGEWDNVTKKANFLTQYNLFYDSGFSILLNVKYTNPGASQIPYPDSANYRNFLSDVLNNLGSKKPAMVYVENEETNKGYFDVTNFNQYIKVLNGAVAECHSRSISVTNGGIIAGSLIPLTWDWLKSRHPGDTALTNGYARKAFAPTRAAALISGSLNSLITSLKQAITLYNNTSIDDINMHWYEPIILSTWNDDSDGNSSGVDKTAVGPGVFDSTISYLDAKFSIPILTNETGQFTSSSTLTNSIMNRYLSYQSLGSNFFPIVCWYDGDGPDQYSAYALHNAYKNGTIYTFSLRSTGISFKNRLQ